MQYKAKLINENTQDKLYNALREAVSEITTDKELIENTPTRWIKAFDEWFANSKESLESIGQRLCKVFPSDNDDMIVASNIEVWSTCQHHLCPYKTHIAIGVIPDGKVMGLSKYTRLVHEVARRFDSGIIEDFVSNISKTLRTTLKTENVAVIAYSLPGDVHTCAASRGANDSQMKIAASSMQGFFREKPQVRQEFMKIMELQKA